MENFKNTNAVQCFHANAEQVRALRGRSRGLEKSIRPRDPKRKRLYRSPNSRKLEYIGNRNGNKLLRREKEYKHGNDEWLV